MLPPSKSDPRWKALVIGSEHLKLKTLATKMIITRVRLMGARKDPQSLTDAIETVYAYFAKNYEAVTVSEDLETIFESSEVTP